MNTARDDAVNVNIQRTLLVCSAHLPWDDCAERIDQEQRMGAETASFFVSATDDALTIYIEETHWRVYTSDEQVAAARALGWEHFANLIQLAMNNDCAYLELDGDASPLDDALGFPVFDWGQA